MARTNVFINATAAEKYFLQEYPGAEILRFPETNPRELICEIEPASMHPNFSVAIAAISESAEHYHMAGEEEFEVLEGELNMRIERDPVKLKAGEKLVIPTMTRHIAFGGFTLVKITSRPGWSELDHILTQAS